MPSKEEVARLISDEEVEALGVEIHPRVEARFDRGMYHQVPPCPSDGDGGEVGAWDVGEMYSRMCYCFSECEEVWEKTQAVLSARSALYTLRQAETALGQCRGELATFKTIEECLLRPLQDVWDQTTRAPLPYGEGVDEYVSRVGGEILAWGWERMRHPDVRGVLSGQHNPSGEVEDEVEVFVANTDKMYLPSYSGACIVSYAEVRGERSEYLRAPLSVGTWLVGGALAQYVKSEGASLEEIALALALWEPQGPGRMAGAQSALETAKRILE